MGVPFVETIDAQQFSLPRTGAVFLIRGSSPVLIESGTAASAPTVCHALNSLPLEYIFLTHIHLDHAGGAGLLAQKHPQAKIVVHERGFRHLANPGRLIDGVRNASPDLFPLYGEPPAIPEPQLLPVLGGEMFDLGKGVQVEVVASPGHAPHHVCFFEHNSRTLFTGDAAGNWDNPVDVPLTVPPGFDLKQGLATLNTLKQLRPQRLAFTHFGIADCALDQLDRYEEQLIEWFELLRKLSARLLPSEIVELVLSEAKYVRLPKIRRDMIAMCIHGAILSLEAGTA